MQVAMWWKWWLAVLKVVALAGHYVSSYRTKIVLGFLLILLLLNVLEQSKNYHLDYWRQNFAWVQTEKDGKVQYKYKQTCTISKRNSFLWTQNTSIWSFTLRIFYLEIIYHHEKSLSSIVCISYRKISKQIKWEHLSS